MYGICTTIHHGSPISFSLLCTIFVSEFVLYLYYIYITILYCICTTGIFVSLFCTMFVPQFILCLYCICITIHYRSPFSFSWVFKLPVRLPIHQSVRWPLSPFLARLVLLGSLTATAIRHFIFNFALGLLKVQRRHNVYRLL